MQAPAHDRAKADSHRAIDNATSGRIPLALIKPGGVSLLEEFKEVWEYRELVVSFVNRDLTTRYRQTLLGATWAVIQPLALMLVLTCFFGHHQLSAGKQAYPLFSYCALLMWQYFSSSVSRGSNSLLKVGGLIKKIYFPQLAAPIASIIPPMVDFLVAFSLLLPLLAIYGVAPTARLLFIPCFLLLSAFSAFGISLWTSALGVKYRDMYHLVPFLLQLLFFASPILYASSAAPEHLTWLYDLNPMVAVIEGVRWSVTIGHDLHPIQIISSLCVSAALTASGLVFFRLARPTFADYL